MRQSRQYDQSRNAQTRGIGIARSIKLKCTRLELAVTRCSNVIVALGIRTELGRALSVLLSEYQVVFVG